MRKNSVLIILVFLLMIFLTSGTKEAERNEKLFGKGVVTQIGLIVKDIEKSSKTYADFLGMDVPEWFLTDTVDKAHTVFRGRTTTARAKLAFFELGNITSNEININIDLNSFLIF